MKTLEPMKPDLAKLDAFTRAYIVAALWSSNDDNGNPLDDSFSIEDIHPDSLERMRADCASFFLRNACFIEDEPAPLSSMKDSDRYRSAGHDFWLTSAGHGSGFWDGGWPRQGDNLTAKSKHYPVESLYVGDDGKLHVS